MAGKADGDIWTHRDVAFSAATGTLVVGDRFEQLDRRSSAVFEVLSERFGEVVSKDELLRQAWPGRTVQENSLVKVIGKLRTSLQGSDCEIATAHGFGYQFRLLPDQALITASDAPKDGQPAPSPRSPAGVPPATALWAVLALATILTLAIVTWRLTTSTAGTIPTRQLPPVTVDPPSAFATVLWVDDHPENNALDVAYLRANNVGVHLARSTGEALSLLGIKHYDLVISDLGRGEDRLAGIELVKATRANGASIPVMIYTIQPEDPDKATEQRRMIAASGAADLAVTPAEVRIKALALAKSVT